MSRYRRADVPGATYFFTLTLADRSSHLLVDEIDRLRDAYAAAQRELPFETVAVCVLPDHLHAVWTPACPRRRASAQAKGVSARRACGNAASGSIKSAMTTICSGMSTTSISTR